MSGGSTQLFLASDHAGFALKEKLKSHLVKKHILHEDLGPYAVVKGDDYPDFIIPLAETVARTKGSKGIVFGGSGQGEAIAANKVKGIRAALYYGGDTKIVSLSREHNDANILSLGARFLKEREALKAVELWLSTDFSRDMRHERRITKIRRYESR